MKFPEGGGFILLRELLVEETGLFARTARFPKIERRARSKLPAFHETH